jgi:hypothetical protein
MQVRLLEQGVGTARQLRHPLGFFLWAQPKQIRGLPWNQPR